MSPRAGLTWPAPAWTRQLIRCAPNNPPALLTEKQVCTYFNVNKRNLDCWRMAGLIPYFKIGRAVRFRQDDVDAALERMRIG